LHRVKRNRIIELRVQRKAFQVFHSELLTLYFELYTKEVQKWE